MTTATLFSKFIAAQSEFANIRQEKMAQAFGRGSVGYKYADINCVLETVRPILNRHGLALIQEIATTSPTEVTVRTYVFDETGEKISSGDFIASTDGLQQRGIQAIGSAITYARRYSLMGFLGLAYGENDDDGRSAVEAQAEYKAPEPSKELLLKAREAANEGIESYKAFWTACSKEDRVALALEHKNLKAMAEGVDA